MKLKTIIADDEPLARERLRFLLSGDEEICVVGECRNGRETVAALKERRVDVLFLDIQMPGRGGFEVLEQVGLAHMPVTVFVTAHNHYAVKAFEVQALDYLTKPVEPERCRRRSSEGKGCIERRALEPGAAEVSTGKPGERRRAKKEYPKAAARPWRQKGLLRQRR